MANQTYHFYDAPILRPSCDTAFKAIFSRNPENLINLLNCAFAFDPPIRSITYLNTELSPDKDGAKTCRLDVAAKLDNGSVVDIEIQLNSDNDMLARSIVYTAKLLSTQVEQGSDESPPNVLALILLNRTIKKDVPRNWHRTWHHSFELRDTDGIALRPGAFRIDFIELQKAKRLQTYRNSVFSPWVEFFTADSYAELATVCAQNSALNQTLETLQMISKEQQIWSDARARWEGEYAINQRLGHAKRQGIAKGKQEAARGMLEAGATREFVCKALKLTEAELTTLLATKFSDEPNLAESAESASTTKSP